MTDTTECFGDCFQQCSCGCYDVFDSKGICKNRDDDPNDNDIIVLRKSCSCGHRAHRDPADPNGGGWCKPYDPDCPCKLFPCVECGILGPEWYIFRNSSNRCINCDMGAGPESLKIDDSIHLKDASGSGLNKVPTLRSNDKTSLSCRYFHS